MKLIKIDRETFKNHISDDKADQFAKTFVAKANMGGDKYWENCIGIVDNGGDLMGAIIVTVSIRKPHVANLQLLHTFAKHRRKGVGKELVEQGLRDAISREAKYLRVSSEIPAFPFYEALGFKWLGEQKSGCRLSMFKINGPRVTDGDFSVEDSIINKAVFTKMRGGCTTVY